MSQDLAKECGCGYGASEDAEEQRVEIDQSKKQAKKGSTSGGALPEEEDEFFVPPPPAPALEPKAPKPAAAAPAAPASVAPVASPKPAPAPAPARAAPKLSLESILADLEGAEASAFGSAFTSLAKGQDWSFLVKGLLAGSWRCLHVLSGTKALLFRSLPFLAVMSAVSLKASHFSVPRLFVDLEPYTSCKHGSHVQSSLEQNLLSESAYVHLRSWPL
eukprot:s4267_g7.t1